MRSCCFFANVSNIVVNFSMEDGISSTIAMRIMILFPPVFCGYLFCYFYYTGKCIKSVKKCHFTLFFVFLHCNTCAVSDYRIK